MILTARRRRKILLFLYALTTICIISFMIRGISIRKVIKSYDEKILHAERNLREEEAKLNRLENELEQVDSLDYIEKIAEERLGLVQSDVIVIKEKPNNKKD